MIDDEKEASGEASSMNLVHLMVHVVIVLVTLINQLIHPCSRRLKKCMVVATSTNGE